MRITQKSKTDLADILFKYKTGDASDKGAILLGAFLGVAGVMLVFVTIWGGLFWAIGTLLFGPVQYGWFSIGVAVGLLRAVILNTLSFNA